MRRIKFRHLSKALAIATAGLLLFNSLPAASNLAYAAEDEYNIEAGEEALPEGTALPEQAPAEGVASEEAVSAAAAEEFPEAVEPVAEEVLPAEPQAEEAAPAESVVGPVAEEVTEPAAEEPAASDPVETEPAAVPAEPEPVVTENVPEAAEESAGEPVLEEEAEEEPVIEEAAEEEIVSEPIEVTVKITGRTLETRYNGEEQVVEGFTADVSDSTVSVKLAEGHEAVARGTEVGTYAMGLSEADFAVISGNDANVTFDITDGKLVITEQIPTYYEADIEGFTITATTEEGAFAEPVNFVASVLASDSDAYRNAEQALEDNGQSYDGMLALDIHFESKETGAEIEPVGKVSVSFAAKAESLTEIAPEAIVQESVQITHIKEVTEESPEVEQPDVNPGDVITEVVADVALETAEVTVEVTEEEVKEIAAEFEVDSFSTFVLTWKVGETDQEATIHYGYYEGGEFQEFGNEHIATLDTTTDTVSLNVNFDNYVYQSASYADTVYTSGISIDETLYNTGDGWECIGHIHDEETETDRTERVSIVNGSDIYVAYAVKQSSDEHDPAPAEVEGPSTEKEVTDNGDGTYTIRLDITGAVKSETSQTGANVLVVMDRTYSMAGSMSGTTSNRWQVSQAAVNTLVNALDCDVNDIDLALVTFYRIGEYRQVSGQTWTKDGTAFVNLVNSIGYNTNLQATGTNWESGLYYALQTLSSRDSDDTYVIFLTDGEPNRHGTTSYAQYNYNNVQRCIADAQVQANAITALSTESSKVYLYGIFCGADSGYNNLSGLINAAGGESTINGTSQSAIEDAFSNIAETIISNLGSKDVSVDDGIPTMASVSSAVVGEAGGYSYYRSGGENEDGTEKYDHTANGGLGETWDDAPGAAYSSDNGVTWDLSQVGTLEDGVTYTITFKVWPSQEAYDLIADLNNGLKDYDDLDQSVKDQITGSKETGYTLKTNTHLYTTYTYNGTTYTDPGEWESAAMDLPTETISVQKIWNNTIDDKVVEEGLDLQVLKDGAVYLENVHVTSPSWKAEDIYISCGQITGSGADYQVIETGHDYTVKETDDLSYHWELTSDIYRPMVINGTAHVLIQDDEAAGTDGTDYYTIAGHKYVVNDGSTSLQATNDRRSWLQLEKKVTAAAGVTVPEDAKFSFTVTVTDVNGDDVWFSAQDPSVSGEDKTVKNLTTNATAEVKDGTATGYFYAASGTPITMEIEAGWTVRFTNLPSGTTYVIEETDLPDGFKFDSIADRQVTETTAEQEDPVKPTINGQTTTGTINVPNVEFFVDYTNTYDETEITVTKVWDDGGDQDGLRPSATGFARYISLLVNGETSTDYDDNRTITDNNNNTYTIKYTKLPKYINNAEAVYTIQESAITSYTTTGNPASNGGTITNSYVPKTTTVTVTKVWADENDKDGFRPDKLSVQLYADDQQSGNAVTLTQDATGAWTYTWPGLPVNAAGKAIKYTVDEPTVPTGYAKTVGEVTGDADTGFSVEITNTHTPETTKVTATKTWSDANNQDGKRPSNATVQLYKTVGDTKTAIGDPVTVPATDGNINVWTELPVYEGGQQITYSVEETLPAGTVYTKSGDDKTLPAVKDDSGTIAITNSYTPEVTKVTATKTWSDSNNQDGKRPTTATVQLYKTVGGTKTAVGEAMAVPAADGTVNVWENLPVYEGGQQITYSVEETLPDDSEYTKSGDDKTLPAVKDDSGTIAITNSYTPEEIELTVKKVWNDADDQDGKRPASLEVTLSNGTADVGSVTLTEENKWTGTIKGLPKYSSGSEITYTWTEESLPEGYKLTETSKDEETGLITTFTNSYEPKVTTSSVKKVWDDADDQDGIRPDTLTVQLMADGEPYGEPIELNEANGWEAKAEGLPVYKDHGTAIEYTWEETTVPEGYELQDPVVEGTLTTLTNIHVPATTTVNVVKAWDDGRDQDGKRPESISVQLYADGKASGGAVTLNEAGQWTYTWSDLPVNAAGEAIDYTVDEPTVPTDYEKEVGKISGDAESGYVVTITNTHTPEETEVTVKKVWDDADDQDGKRPDSLEVTLSNGDTVTLNKGNGWTATVTGLPKYNAGEEVEYTWTESSVPAGYTLSGTAKDGTVTTLTNSYTPETTEVEGKKTWDDNDDQDGLRPASITINLLADGEVIQTRSISERDGWTWKFTDLPKYKAGTEIEYTITEEAVSGYTTTVSGYDVTNTHTPELITINGSKIWNDEDNADGIRPGNITVNLFANGVQIRSMQTSAEYNWAFEFTDLPRYQDGAEINYTITEDPVDGYTTVISGFTITNTHTRQTPPPPYIPDPPSPPIVPFDPGPPPAVPQQVLGATRVLGAQRGVLGAQRGVLGANRTGDDGRTMVWFGTAVGGTVLLALWFALKQRRKNR